MDERFTENQEELRSALHEEVPAAQPAARDVTSGAPEPAAVAPRPTRVGMVREIEIVQSPFQPATARPFLAPPRPPLRSTIPNTPAPAPDREFNAALAKSKEIVAAARVEAEKIVRDAEGIVVEEREQARKRGLEEGRIEAARSLLKLSALRDSVISSAEREIMETAVLIAEEVVGESLKLQPESIMARVRRAMNFALNARRITLAVNPADADYVRPRLDEILSSHTPNLNLAIREDSSLNRGDARLETEISIIESSVAAHLAAVRGHLKSLSEEADGSEPEELG